MSLERQPGPASSSNVDDEGVRVLRKATAPRFGIEARLSAGIALTVAVVVGISLWGSPSGEPTPPATAPSALDEIPGARPVPTTATPAVAIAVAQRLERPSAVHSDPSGDPDDLASYFRPGDPVPSTANLIKALNEAGVRTGIAAFNPPGTSPPLEGLAVPADFELPPGYVRHHQATDDGETIEPILMFSPDLVLRDAQGRPIPMPADRVVPPEWAPPGLPLRWVRPGKP